MTQTKEIRKLMEAVSIQESSSSRVEDALAKAGIFAEFDGYTELSDEIEELQNKYFPDSEDEDAADGDYEDDFDDDFDNDFDESSY